MDTAFIGLQGVLIPLCIVLGVGKLVEEKIKQWFENVDPEDFSKYEM